MKRAQPQPSDSSSLQGMTPRQLHRPAPITPANSASDSGSEAAAGWGAAPAQTTSSQLIQLRRENEATDATEQWRPRACSYHSTTSETPLYVTHLLSFQRSPFCPTCGSHAGQQDTTHHLHAEHPQSGKPRRLIHQRGELCRTTVSPD